MFMLPHVGQLFDELVQVERFRDGVIEQVRGSDWAFWVHAKNPSLVSLKYRRKVSSSSLLKSSNRRARRWIPAFFGIHNHDRFVEAAGPGVPIHVLEESVRRPF